MSEQSKTNESPIDTVIDTLLESAENDVARIPERDFKQFLLPLFVNKDVKDFSGWLKIAGSWARPIDVTEDRDNKKVLFRVPALVGRSAPPSQQSARNSAYDLLRDVERKSQIVPRAGHELLKRGLNDRLRVTGDRSAAIEQWNAIFRRYGFTNLILENEEPTTTKTVPDSNLDENIDGYDDL